MFKNTLKVIALAVAVIAVAGGSVAKKTTPVRSVCCGIPMCPGLPGCPLPPAVRK